MGQILGDTSNIPGGTSGALQTGFPQSVDARASQHAPKAAMVIEGDFVPGVATTKGLKPFTDYNMFAFPSINGSPPAVMAAATRRHVQGLARDTGVDHLPGDARRRRRSGRSEAASPRRTRTCRRARTTTPSRGRPRSRSRSAKLFRFDMSDLEPAAFGGTTGQGEWKIFQDFLKNPKNVNGTPSALESSAAKAFKIGT